MLPIPWPPRAPPPAPNQVYETQLLSLPQFSDLFCRKPVRYDTRNCSPSRTPEPAGPYHYTLQVFQLLHLHSYPGLEVLAFSCHSRLPQMQSLGTTLPVIHIPAVFHLLNTPILGSFKMKLRHRKINSDQLYSPEWDLSVSYHKLKDTRMIASHITLPLPGIPIILLKM